MAEDTVDAAVKVLGRRSLRCVTKDLRLRGATPGGHTPARPGGVAPDHGAPPDDEAVAVAAHLARRYGTETPAVLSVADDDPELLEPLVPGLHYLEAEALYAVREEMALSVADVLDRRTRASLRDARGSADAALRVASLIGPELGWDGERIHREAAAYAERLRAELARAGLDEATAAEQAGGAGGDAPGAGGEAPGAGGEAFAAGQGSERG